MDARCRTVTCGLAIDVTRPEPFPDTSTKGSISPTAITSPGPSSHDWENVVEHPNRTGDIRDGLGACPMAHIYPSKEAIDRTSSTSGVSSSKDLETCSEGIRSLNVPPIPDGSP